MLFAKFYAFQKKTWSVLDIDIGGKGDNLEF